MKPRITRDHSITCKRTMWFCRGNGSLGLGDNPKQAFWDWKARQNEKFARLIAAEPKKGQP